jgi:MFS family permease/flagellar motor switch/type III secretory pathway protein FliN
MGPELKDNRSSFRRIIVGFLPLIFGCFLSVLFQEIDSIVANDLMTDLAIGEGTLGIRSAAFLVAFAACLLPSGIAIDRYGPRRFQSVMMGVTALGALIFGLSTGPFGLTIGRALLGAGAASALLAAIKAIVTWCPRERLGLAAAGLLAVAGLGALVAAGPAALFAGAFGWRTLFILLAALAGICAILTARLVPTAAGELSGQDGGLPFILRDPIFRRFAPLAAVVVGTVWAIQGQWLAAWLAAGNELQLTDIVARLSLMAVGQAVGSLVWGWLADWAVRKRLSAASVFAGAAALCICIQIAVVVGIASPTAIVWSALVAGAAAMLPFVVLVTQFPKAYAARACASIGLLQSVASLFIQSAIGFVVAIWPHEAGQASAIAYAMAFRVPVALQLAALAWFLFPRSETGEGAQGAGKIAPALASIRSASQPLFNILQGLLHHLTQRRGAAPAQHQQHGLSEPPSMSAGLPVDAPADSAAEPADPAIKPIGTALAPSETDGETAAAASTPAETVEAPTDLPTAPAGLAAEPDDAAMPIDTALAPTGTAGETAVAASAPAETMEALTDTPPASASLAAEPADNGGATADSVAVPADAALEPTDGPVSPGETMAPPIEAALRSILGAPLSGSLGGAPDPTMDASAAPASEAEVAQPLEREPSFPLIPPSHVQALNAVYRPRPALAATIGGRQASIIAAWPPPDRRPDASHRVSLRIDGEPGELWLPQSLLDVLVGSVDPALSLDRLGPDRAAIILEFALDGLLTTVEMNLGCKLGVDSFSGKVERLENHGQLPLFFNVVIDGLVTTGCELRIPPDYALRLAEGLDRHAGISRYGLDLPIPVCLRVAAANLAAHEVERLAPDDVVLVDASCQPGHVIAVIGERLVAPVALTPEGHRLAANPIPGATSSWAWSMPTDAMAGAWHADAETDNRPLHVLFEIGRFELPASKVKQLAPNALLPLAPLHDQTVDIVVDGQRIGRGNLMQIGNRTGVRVNTVRERPGSGSGLKRAPAEERTGFK